MTQLSTLSPDHDDTVYPESPEKPRPQSDWHRTLIGLLIDALMIFYRGQRVYVSGDIFVYFRRGDTSAAVSPDLFIVRDVEQRRRGSYRAWTEGGRLPKFAVEILSHTTGDDDLEDKFKRYRDDLKVKEYFVFDPERRRIAEGVQGFRLRGKRYVPIAPVDGRLPSEESGLHLEADGDRLRLWDPATRAWLLTEAEAQAARAEAAEAEIARLRDELARLRGGATP